MAIDRARYNVNPPAARSPICTQCFQQYCFDPNNLTSASELPNRKLNFVDPAPEGVSAVTGFLATSKVPIILGFVFVAFSIAAVSAFMCAFSLFFSLFYGSVFDEFELFFFVFFFCLVEYGEDVAGRV